MPTEVTIINETDHSVEVNPLLKVLKALQQEFGFQDRTIEVLIVTDDQIKACNNNFRGVNSATDVLSFPGPDWPGAPLGEIVISLDFAILGAKERDIPLELEIAALGLHGGLHLCGFDDESEAEYNKMNEQMRRILALTQIAVPGDWMSLPHGD